MEIDNQKHSYIALSGGQHKNQSNTNIKESMDSTSQLITTEAASQMIDPHSTNSGLVFIPLNDDESSSRKHSKKLRSAHLHKNATGTNKIPLEIRHRKGKLYSPESH